LTTQRKAVSHVNCAAAAAAAAAAATAVRRF
jgi:hypothetical protein